MKNFTKQILNKTLFKPTRWLLVALMFLLGTSGAWAFNLSGSMYFDNSETKWANCYMYIGHGTYGRAYTMSLVSGTRYLWKYTNDGTWSGATAWYVSSEQWSDWTGGKGEGVALKACWHNANTFTHPYTSAYGANVYKATGTSTYSSSDCSKSAYNWSSTKPSYSTTYTITLNIVGSGSVTIKNNAGTALISGATANTSKTGVTYLTYLRYITATPSSGSKLSSIKIGSTDYTSAYQNGDAGEGTSGKGYDLTGNVTITVTFEKSCTTVATPDVSVDKSAVCEGDKVKLTLNSRQDGVTYKIGTTEIFSGTTTYEFVPTGNVSVVASHANSCNGATAKKDITIKVDNPSKLTLTYAETKICKGEEVTLNDFVYSNTGTVTWYNSYSYVDSNKANDTVSPTSTHKYYATAKNGECGIAEAQLNVIVNDKPAKPTLSAENGVTEIISGTNTVTLIVGNTETDATYTLYKDGSSTSKTGTKFENISEAGKYTVVGNKNNGCGNSEASNAIEVTSCTPISNPTLTITSGKKDIYCPGDYVNVTLTYNGNKAKSYKLDGKDNNNIVVSGGTIANNAPLTLTINGTGNISMILTGCDGNTATTNELSFTVAPAPKKPVVSISPNPVGQNKPATLNVSPYDESFNYTISKDGASVGNYTSATTITHANVGEYKYTVTATSKTCPSLSETSNEVTLTVLEAGAKIDALGATALFTNDPTHFIPMYVEKDGIVDVEGATKVTGYTWEFSEDGSTNWTACNYTYANFNAKNNKSQHQVVVTNGDKDCNNWRANAVGYYRCKMTYDTGASQYSNSIQVTAGTNSNTNKQHIGITYNLPIISVNTGDKDFPSDASLSGYPSASADDLKKKRSVDVKIFNPDGTVCYDRKARMAYRGSSSLNFQKKSYAFCPGKAKCGDEEKSVDYVKTSKENLFGLSNGAEDKDWVLYAATPEPSMMRNRLTFDLYKEMRPQDWGVNSMYVELVINGEYKGVYVLMDKITQNKNRVKLSSADAFIVKFDKTDCADRIGGYNGKVGDEKTFITSKSGKFGIDTYDTKVDQAFEIEYPEKEDFEDVNVGSWVPFTDKVKEKFVQFETALEKKDYTTVRSIIDYDSWADWYILTEFIKNQDGFRASNIFVYDGEKIEARPLWDQELSFNNQARISHSCDKTAGLLITTSSIYEDHFKAPFWFTGGNNSITGGLLSDPCFVSLVKQKWAEYSQDGGLLTKSHIESKVSSYDSELGAAQSREAARWPYTGAVRGMTNNGKTIGYYGKNEGIEIGYADSKSDILSWANGRVGGFTTALNGLEGEALIFTMTPSVEVTPWQIGIINIHAPAGYTYTVDFSQVENAGGYVTNDNATYSVKLPRPIDWAQGGNGSTTLSKTYTVTAKLELDSEENTCGFTSTENTKDSVITLKDETEECNPEVTR